MKLGIELAHLDDAQGIRDHQLAHALEVEGLQLEGMRVLQGVSQVFENPHLGFYLVARNLDSSNQTVVASLLITKEWSDWRARSVWWIQSVYVQPDFRRQGIFSRMYRHIERQAKFQGAAGLRLYVHTRNTGAQRVYQKIGMKDEHYKMYEVLFDESLLD